MDLKGLHRGCTCLSRVQGLELGVSRIGRAFCGVPIITIIFCGVYIGVLRNYHMQFGLA